MPSVTRNILQINYRATTEVWSFPRKLHLVIWCTCCVGEIFLTVKSCSASASRCFTFKYKFRCTYWETKVYTSNLEEFQIKSIKISISLHLTSVTSTIRNIYYQFILWKVVEDFRIYLRLCKNTRNTSYAYHRWIFYISKV